MRNAALLLAAVLVAGCSGAGPGAGDSLTSTSAPPSEAGGATSSSSSSPAPADAANPPATREMAYSFAGRTWTTACVVAQPAVGRCQHLAEGSNVTERWPGEAIVRIRGSLSWAEGNDVVGIGLVWEEGGEIQFDPEFYAEGTSPLAFDWNVARLSGKDLAYHVASYASAGVPEAHASASPGQDWSLEATLTVLAAGPGSGGSGSSSAGGA